MPKKIKLKTKTTTKSVTAFINSITEKTKRADARTLLALMKRVTKKQPKMWGESIVGFGAYTYTRSNGDYGEFMATGFSPRKDSFSLYILPGYQDLETKLAKLGKHKKGRACLYIKTLTDIDLKVLESIVRAGYREMQSRYTVT